MMTMTKMFCMFRCLGCAVASDSEEDELDMALVDAAVVLGDSTDTPSTDTERHEDDTESDGTATPDAGNAAAHADTPPGPVSDQVLQDELLAPNRF